MKEDGVVKEADDHDLDDSEGEEKSDTNHKFQEVIENDIEEKEHFLAFYLKIMNYFIFV